MRKLSDNLKWAITGIGIGLAVAGLVAAGVLLLRNDKPATEELVAAAADLNATFLEVCAAEGYQFTPKVREAYLEFAKAQALSDLRALDKDLPRKFLEKIEEDSVMEACVYAAPANTAHVLLNLYELRLDLGEDDFEEYNQLALASAYLNVTNGPNADITERKPLVLKIGGDPRKPVNTKPTNRPLDFNDHVINFLNENTITEEVVVGARNPIPQYQYDENGKFVPAEAAAKPKPDPKVKTQVTRTLRASDVLESVALQQQFNAYMNSKGHRVNLDCGEKIIHWSSREMVRGVQHKNLADAYMMFRKAYEAKGLLPEQRDPIPTQSERCAYLIRNDKYEFSESEATERKWPRFPLKAPWPMLTMLAANNQPLREREERWLTFVKTGEFKTYGEYIGSIAQQHDMQSARRLTPYPFHYDTIQMMLKDGGVCGVMGGISARSHSTLGIPASTAHQPGHCAVVAYHFDAKKKLYTCRGSQYVTGGDDKTWPHTPWVFEREYSADGKGRKGMVYHQSTAWAANYGIAEFMDSLMAYQIYKRLPEAIQSTQGVEMLKSGLAINPCNFLLVDKIQDAFKVPRDHLDFWAKQSAAIAAAAQRSGCPADGLYAKQIKTRMYVKLAELPVPENRAEAAEVLAFLEKEKCDHADAVMTYRLANEGLPGMLLRVERELAGHLGGVQTAPSAQMETAALAMSKLVEAALKKIPIANQRKTWAFKLWQFAKTKPKYFGKKYRVLTHPVIPVLAKYSGEKMPDNSKLLSPLLYQLTNELQQSVKGTRTEAGTKILAAKIKASAAEIENVTERYQWFQLMDKIMFGKRFLPIEKKGKSVLDPCATLITNALKLPPTAAQ